ncbi:hypothetical protein HBI56_129750 [Parastagonospora nodorum]|uniref:Uncharacterized protein n=1 Tax=Phaeosphaeria nodorum (strain SN15 / ATCC MYA-4574 / FGSC 10173) TaxID=321614 RepID=A0A7U2EZH5_PHANO|nr:hypothetical protein HBH56_154060 [Parastagonospora nodorum]QRC95963.1 hypothetical protein JI435_303900 [Parastagonospora nodorum SN15]KAH3926750.1 hypothetical protein HBH54_163620 [Parastagonospora nodorum]KAH3943267.1 hypothetical protein HBH53_175580 [Parastagonospora nodorum]KAH3970412.1 hypothetical protein HBH52_167270 [Parastagonospora nodorum]
MASGGNNPVWIRTCYAPDLQSACEKIIETAAYFNRVDRLSMLDNEDLYVGDAADWAKLLLRMPLLPDAVPHMGGDSAQEDIPLDDNLPEDESFIALYEAS